MTQPTSRSVVLAPLLCLTTPCTSSFSGDGSLRSLIARPRRTDGSHPVIHWHLCVNATTACHLCPLKAPKVTTTAPSCYYASASAARGGRARTADDGAERGAAVHCASSTVPPVVFATNGFYAAPVAAAAPTLSPQQDPPTRPAMPPHRFAAHALAAICAVRTPARARQNRMVSFAEHEAAAASGALMEVQPRRPRQPWAATAARRGAYPFTTRSSGSRTPSTPRTTRACRSRPLNIAGTTLMEMFTVGASYPFNAGIPYCD
ncbi:hypothetical protein GGX14DRAFT_401137 [Mycena pura]|uniref:Uncharacterized protein n=1 Tax=Mycena pura TaxID=153505 RepID=A0AAD6Y8U7_9AGAR|nr:hypothetical protein GGX14DRAFT_401137 [Mycena pura]